MTSHSFHALFCDCGLSQDLLYIYLNRQQPAFCCLFSTFLKVGKKSVRAKCTTEYRFNSHHFAGFAVKSKTLKSKLWHVYYAPHWHFYTFFFNGKGNFPNWSCWIFFSFVSQISNQILLKCFFCLLREGKKRKSLTHLQCVCLPPTTWHAAVCLWNGSNPVSVSQSANMLAERTAFALWKYSHFIVCRFDIKCLLGATSHFEDAHAG